MQYVYTAVALLLALTTQAQTDSVRTEFKTEDEAISKSEVKRFIRYITRANVEEKTLVKLGVWPSTQTGDMRSSRPLFYVGVNAETTIERKVSPAFSVFAGVNYSLHYVHYERVLTNGPINGLSELVNKQRDVAVVPKAGVRYYYAMAKRVRQGTAANNFSGNYVSFQAEQYLIDNQRKSYYDFVNGDSRTGLNTYVVKKPIFFSVVGLSKTIGSVGVRRPERWAVTPVTVPKCFVIKFFRQVPSGKSLSLQINALIGVGW